MSPDNIPSQLVEITASFTYLGNYQSADFFCAQKAECPAQDAETKYYQLREFCRREVMKATEAFREETGMNHR